METHETMDQTIDIITSFNADYYNRIGYACVSSWLANWPQDLTLTCYVEDCQLQQHPRIRQVPFTELPATYHEFQAGQHHQQEKKFAKKAWTVIHALASSQADWVIWIDSDVITTQPMTTDMISWITPADRAASCLGVWYDSDKRGNPGRYFVPETGLFGVNLRHRAFPSILEKYYRHYRDNEWEGCRRRLDNDAFGSALLPWLDQVHDMAGNLEKGYLTPLPRTRLAPYLQHFKAKHSKADFDPAQHHWDFQLALVQ